MIKVETYRNRKTRSDYAFEVKTMEGVVIFRDGESNGGKSHHLLIQEAMEDAIIKTKELGYTKMLILCNSKRLVQICSQRSKPTWLEQTLILDLNQL